MTDDAARDARPAADAPWFGLVRALVHDLRTPIATASGYLELIELDSPALPEPYPEYLARAAIAVREIASLTTILMEVARLDGGKRPLQLASIEAARLVHRVVARRRPLERAAIESPALVAGAQRQIRCDPELVDRAIDALLDIALARSPRDGRVTLDVSWPAEQRVRFSVRDAGTPIDDTRLAQLFSHRRAAAEGGNAARLAFVYCSLVATAHRGDAGAARPADGGMEFWLELPDDPATEPPR